MPIELNEVRIWLYRSEFASEKTQSEIETLGHSFAANNETLGLTGFLITNGKAVMQLLEGSPRATEKMKRIIKSDDRHVNIVSEVWTVEAVRAYPNWAMRTSRPHNYEALFKEIESAKIETIAIKIARMVFDITFE